MWQPAFILRIRIRLLYRAAIQANDDAGEIIAELKAFRVKYGWEAAIGKGIGTSAIRGASDLMQFSVQCALKARELEDRISARRQFIRSLFRFA